MDKKVPLFVDSQAQEEFNRKGYTKLSLLDETQTCLLREAYALYEKEHLDVKLPFISTSHSNNARLIASVDRSILEVAEPAIHKHITNAQVLFSNFLVKRTGADTATGPHQDTTFVDESEACSYSLWIALEDVSVHNGCMKVLERSHLFPRYIRSNPLKHWRYRGIIERMEKDMLPVPLKKGEALVFPHSLIHSSFPNLSSVNRLAAVVACYTPGAQLWHYETNKKNEAVVEQYAMTKDAFLAYVKGAAPQLGKLVAEFPIETSPINKITYYYFRLNARLNRQSAV